MSILAACLQAAMHAFFGCVGCLWFLLHSLQLVCGSLAPELHMLLAGNMQGLCRGYL